VRTISSFLSGIQRTLFPALEEEWGPLTEFHQKVATILEMAHVEKGIRDEYWFGRPISNRQALARAFLAKAVANAPFTKDFRNRILADPILRRLCGWQERDKVPSESTFSRAFHEFAKMKLAEQRHEELVKETFSDHLFGHISQDSTEIDGREKPVKKPKPKEKPKKKRGRPKKGEEQPPEPTRIERQLTMIVSEMIAELPTVCDRGTKRNSEGYYISWNGFKLHIDTADGQIPISCILTSASVHDSQVSIPLTTLTYQRVMNLYDAKDSAYDCQHIAAYSVSLGHVPIIDPNSRNGETRELAPAEKVRYRVRSNSERVNARLKDEFGGRMIRVQGAVKVMSHLMFGILALTVDQMIRMVN
jgi:hypothetical protein